MGALEPPSDASSTEHDAPPEAPHEPEPPRTAAVFPPPPPPVVPPPVEEEATSPTPQPETEPPAAPGEPAPAAAGSSNEVVPPDDVDEGPGWAFTERMSEGAAGPANPTEGPLHDEARRLARLLVSEIKLYNEEQIEEGRRRGNIYEHLREDIDRSRQMYEERIDQSVRQTTDYFRDELVRSLAGGDAEVMGL